MGVQASRGKDMYLFLSIRKASIHFFTQNYMTFDSLFMYSDWAEHCCIDM
jgi:hypothetical protein